MTDPRNAGAGEQLEQREREGLAARDRHRHEHRDRDHDARDAQDPSRRAAGGRSRNSVQRAVTATDASGEPDRPLALPSRRRSVRKSPTTRSRARTPAKITPCSLKNPRLTSCQRGVHQRNTRPPATVSASTSAMSPAAPLTYRPLACRATAYRRNALALGSARRRARASARYPFRMDDWRSYDDVAETYERVHAPRFAEPARDLVAARRSATGDRVLDVGTGTGVAARGRGRSGRQRRRHRRVARHAPVGHRVRPKLRLAAADAIDLPFRDRHVRRRDRQVRARALHEGRDRVVRGGPRAASGGKVGLHGVVRRARRVPAGLDGS